MRKFLLLIILATTIVFSMAQTATDFTVNDCDGVSHNLFSELDEGKVIVLCWVMPCGGCVSPAQNTHSVVQSYQWNNPNTVYFWMADDFGTTSCSNLNNWGNSNFIPASSSSIRFSDPAIDMDDYGSYGMPKVVVLGGANHTVFYDANYSVNTNDLRDAIDEALIATNIGNLNNETTHFSVFPNPAINKTNVKFSLTKASDVKIELYNMQGKNIKTILNGNLPKGENKLTMDVTDYESGVYLLKLTDSTSSQYLNVIVSH